ncbi:MAG TPA: NAD(P)H-hydrate epimerase [Propionibacteriaceae bacterium]|nr:NAD(P)H-hydrate epimerase [Propionibacteriaceae bacterium]
MRPVVTAEAVRGAEEAFFAATPDADLMGIAAGAVAASARRMLDDAREPWRVLVVAGPGNNGGDGLFAGAELARYGAEVLVLPTASTIHPGGIGAAREAGCQIVDAPDAVARLAGVDLVIDAVLGIAGRPGLREPVATLAAEAEALGVPVLAVDLPSGLDADSGAVTGPAFAAARTVTFIAEKLCHVAEPAASRCGEVEVVDIGVPVPGPVARVAERADVARLWPWPDAASDKYSRGVVGIDTGSDDYTGAALLGTLGAVHAGAGMVRYAGPERVGELLRPLLPSVVHGTGRVQAWVCGSGWGRGDGTRQRLSDRVADGVPMVVDADALGALDDVTLPEGSLLTPHAGELARLLAVDRDAVRADPIGHAREAARRHGATVLLKGATQYVVDPDGDVRIAVPGPAWTAQAGSGDTLAGIAGTLLAAGLSASDAGTLAASIQAAAAAENPGPWPPDELARRLPATIAGLQAAVPPVSVPPR